MNHFKKLIEYYSEIVFPVTCACCGAPQEKKGEYLCEWCKNDRFERVYGNKTEVVPEKIEFVFSMWNFDKGGYLQGLLHDLKYNFLRGVGEELGRFTARTFLEYYRHLHELEEANPVIVPVPLHKSKKRTRGYNQARALSRGFSQVTGWDVLDSGEVIRIRKTRTQTGLSSADRSKNVKGAFKIAREEVLQNRFPIIIDDVFTTGATTYELADVLLYGRKGKAGIVTVAKA